MKVTPPNHNNIFWTSSLLTPKLPQWVHSIGAKIFQVGGVLFK